MDEFIERWLRRCHPRLQQSNSIGYPPRQPTGDPAPHLAK